MEQGADSGFPGSRARARLRAAAKESARGSRTSRWRRAMTCAARPPRAYVVLAAASARVAEIAGLIRAAGEAMKEKRRTWIA